MDASLAREQLSRVFNSLLPDAFKPHLTGDTEIIMRIPASAPEVGDLLVYNEGDELTVEVGAIDHRHFEVYCEVGSQPERERKAAQAAIDWIQEIISEQVRFRNEFTAGRCIAGWYPECEGGEWLIDTADEFREYTWSGEKAHGHRSKG
jgi:hypothetical protein